MAARPGSAEVPQHDAGRGGLNVLTFLIPADVGSSEGTRGTGVVMPHLQAMLQLGCLLIQTAIFLTSFSSFKGFEQGETPRKV